MRPTRPAPAAWRRPLACLLALSSTTALVGCTNLPDIFADGVCGNGIIEPTAGEDCEPEIGIGAVYACGDPDTSVACRLTCLDAESACPPGWGCAYDGICRVPAGEFGDRRTISGLAGEIAVGDLDGDERADLVNVAEPFMTVAFGDGDGDFETFVTVPIDSAPEPPVLANIEPVRDDEAITDDVIVYSGSRVNVYRGRADQELDPVAVPEGLLPGTIDEAVVLGLRGGDPAGREVALLLTRSGETVDVYLPSTSNDGTLDFDPAEGRSVTVPEDSRFPTRTATADLDPGAADALDEVAWGVVGGSTVYIESIDCAYSQMPTGLIGCTLESRGEVELGAALGEAGTFFGDIDGDGVLDLVADLGDQRFAVALGTAVDGAFAGFGDVRRVRLEAMPAAGPLMTEVAPLAVADLGRGRAEIITSQGSFQVMLGQPEPSTRQGYMRPFNRPVGDALAVDFNQDGMNDVLVRSGEGAVLFINAGNGAFNSIELQTNGGLIDMRVGDFDGDLELDLLAITRDGLEVGFADGTGIPRTFVAVAEEEDGYVALDVVRLSDRDGDSTDDVVALRTGDIGLQLIVLRGSGVRRLSAPLSTPYSIVSLTVLARRDRVALVVAAAQTEQGPRFLVVDEEHLDYGPFDDDYPVPVYDACGITRSATILVPIDSDGDGDDEAVVVPTSGMGSEGRASWTPYVVRNLEAMCDDEREDCTARQTDCVALEPVDFGGEAISTPDEVLVGDFDGDGHADLLITHHGQPAQPDGDGGDDTRDALAIWWGSATGLDPTPAVFESDFISDEFNGPIGVTELDGTLGAELIVAGRDGAYALDIDGRTVDVDPDEPLDIPGVEWGEVRSIHVTDLDLDGVPDLVLGSAERVVVVLQFECTAQDANEDLCQRPVPDP